MNTVDAMLRYGGNESSDAVVDLVVNVSSLFDADDDRLVPDADDYDGPMWSPEMTPFDNVWYRAALIALYGLVCAGCIVGKRFEYFSFGFTLNKVLFLSALYEDSLQK